MKKTKGHQLEGKSVSEHSKTFLMSPIGPPLRTSADRPSHSGHPTKCSAKKKRRKRKGIKATIWTRFVR